MERCLKKGTVAMAYEWLTGAAAAGVALIGTAVTMRLGILTNRTQSRIQEAQLKLQDEASKATQQGALIDDLSGEMKELRTEVRTLRTELEKARNKAYTLEEQLHGEKLKTESTYQSLVRIQDELRTERVRYEENVRKLHDEAVEWQRKYQLSEDEKLRLAATVQQQQFKIQVLEEEILSLKRNQGHLIQAMERGGQHVVTEGPQRRATDRQIDSDDHGHDQTKTR